MMTSLISVTIIRSDHMFESIQSIDQLDAFCQTSCPPIKRETRTIGILNDDESLMSNNPELIVGEMAPA